MWVCLQQWNLSIRLWKATCVYSVCMCCLGNNLGYLEIPLEPLWPTTQLDVTQSWYRKRHLVTRECQLGLCLPRFFGNFIQITFISVYILGSFYYIRFPYSPPPKALNFSYLTPYFFPHPLTTTPHLIFLFQFPHLSITIPFPFPKKV